MKWIFTLFVALSALGLPAQQIGSAPGNDPLPGEEALPRIELKKAIDPIVLDGELKEKSWSQARPARRFWQYFPYDSLHAAGDTEIFMTYDEENLYVAAVCHSRADRFIVNSLRRDYSFRGIDNLTLVFDTFNDKTNAFVFGINPYGVLREALISGGGKSFRDFSDSWDNKWAGNAKIHGNYWVAEVAIPFKTLRFQEGSTVWRFNAYRNDTQTNELSTWIRIPRNQIIMDLGYMGELVFAEPLKKPGKNISVIPYLTAGGVRDYEDPEQTRPDMNFDFGGDAKIALTSGLNLDLTFNPDFSQVEVDRQVTNLTRFEIFFPERRQFFLENADLFGNFGLRGVNPFFSRRIGVATDTATGQNIQSTILYGLRLNGKVNENLRLGVLNMQTAKDESGGLPGFNYSVVALQRKVFDRSNVAFLFVNKQAINGEENTDAYDLYNRLAGLEYRLNSADNRFAGKAFWYQAFTTDPAAEQKFAHGFNLEFNEYRYRIEWNHLYVGNGFDAQVGFVPRRDFLSITPEFRYFFYPEKGAVNRHGPGLRYELFLDPGKDGNEYLGDFKRSDERVELFWELRYTSGARLRLGLERNFVFLFKDFDPTRKQDESVFLPAGSDYAYYGFSARFNSDRRKRIFVEMEPTLGEFFNGFRAGVRGNVNLRFQPYGSIALQFNYNHIRLDEPFQPVNLYLIGPRIDLTFSKTLFLTTFIQYNSQIDNLNVNARLQWRYKPVSDFFLVYTDNYLPDSLAPRSRALVAKLTYWLNL